MRIVMVCPSEPGRRGGLTERMLLTLGGLRPLGTVELVTISRSDAVDPDLASAADDVRRVQALGRRGLPTDYALALAGWRPRRLSSQRLRAQSRLLTPALRPAPDLVWAVGASAFLALPADLMGSIPVVADLIDVEDQRNLDLAALATSWNRLRTLLARREGVALRRAFGRIADRASLAVVASPVDADRLDHPAVRVLPNGYDRRGEPAGTGPLADRPTFVYAGRFTYPPNADAVRWLAREIWPRVRTALPTAELRLVGSGLPADADRWGLGITALGPVPTMPPALAGAWATVAPLRSGAGTRVKILEGWAHHLPVVSTTVGAEGLDAEHEHDILLADDGADFAAQMVRAATDEGLRARLVAAGAERWQAHHSPAAVAEVVRELVEAAAHRRTNGA